MLKILSSLLPYPPSSSFAIAIARPAARGWGGFVMLPLVRPPRKYRDGGREGEGQVD